MLSVAKYLSNIEFIQKNNREIKDSIHRFSSIKRKMSFFKLEQKVDSDIEAAYWFLIEVFKMVFLLEPILLYNSLENLRNSQKDLETVYRFVGEVDLCVSIASLHHEGTAFCVPLLNNTDNKFTFENLCHPLIVNCVANSLTTEKSMLITGSNMSGKTTFMRAIGLNYISGISLNTCFASSATLPNAKLLSMIRIEDDVTEASSYFFKEMKTMRSILSEVQATPFSIVLVDELFKGTNTVERIAISKAVLSFLSNQACQIFVSTHDLELADLLESEFELGYFSEVIEKDKLVFDFKLKKGIPPQRNAIRILELHGFPPEIIALSNEIVNEK
jgi:DNA mismatch repair ATPase MutS